MKISKYSVVLFAALLGNVTSASAATLSQQFYNDFESNHILLWTGEATTQITNVTLDSAPVSNWLASANTGDELFLQSDDGSTVAATTGNFTVEFEYTAPTFSIQWVEVFWDGVTSSVLGSGTVIYGGSGWAGNNIFTHAADIVAPAAVPVPASGIFLASGALLGLRCVRRSDVKPSRV